MNDERINEYKKYFPDAVGGAITIGVEEFKKLLEIAQKQNEEIKQLKIQIHILEEGKDCYTCKYLELEEKQEPCRSCIEQSNWEVEE